MKQPLMVHRVSMYKSVRRPLCFTPPIYRITRLSCTYVEHDDGRIDVSYVDSPVDCMACLVEESRAK